MILADTSVWIQHFRKGEPALKKILDHGLLLMHPAVRGELACGCLAERSQTLRYLGALPRGKNRDGRRDPATDRRPQTLEARSRLDRRPPGRILAALSLRALDSRPAVEPS